MLYLCDVAPDARLDNGAWDIVIGRADHPDFADLSTPEQAVPTREQAVPTREQAVPTREQAVPRQSRLFPRESRLFHPRAGCSTPEQAVPRPSRLFHARAGCSRGDGGKANWYFPSARFLIPVFGIPGASLAREEASGRCEI
eukprot:gene1090-biopygen6882